MDGQCIFCKIINKETPSDIVHEDSHVAVFKDINPQAPVHLLIVPKAHIAGLNDLKPEHSEVLAHIPMVAKNLAKELGLAEDGWRLVINCGADARQTVFHFHVHLLGGRPLTAQMA
jgi:histidine triad (HIT) family protein